MTDITKDADDVFTVRNQPLTVDGMEYVRTRLKELQGGTG